VRSVIILFAKAPVPGRVKTRLMPVLSETEAADLHTAFVGDLTERLLGFREADLELHTDIPSDAWPDPEVSRKLQIPGDLGLRMFHSLTTALSEGYERAMIVGTDAPTLPLDYLHHLLVSDADVTLGPTEDGGYYAICAKRTQSGMFAGVRWSSPNALEDSRRAIESTGLSVGIGPSWWDVDEPADLDRLAASNDLPPRTRAFLRRRQMREHLSSR
jgi:rSAM/selenodomain-associated transferase 1